MENINLNLKQQQQAIKKSSANFLPFRCASLFLNNSRYCNIFRFRHFFCKPNFSISGTLSRKPKKGYMYIPRDICPKGYVSKRMSFFAFRLRLSALFFLLFLALESKRMARFSDQ